MTVFKVRNALLPALLSGALVFLFCVATPFCIATASGQNTPPQQRGTQAPKPAAPSSTTKTTAPSAATTPPPNTSSADAEEDEVIRVTSNLVSVPVSVTDAKGQPIQGMTADSFRLDEEGRKQEITQIGTADQVPLELALLLDVSGSVDARFSFEQEAATRFLKEVLRPADKATIYAIGIKPQLVQSRASIEQVTQKLAAIQPTKSPTAFYDTVVDAARYLLSSAPPRHRRVIVAISDGEDTFSERFKAAAATVPEVQRTEIVFYSINPTGRSLWMNKISMRGQEGMQQLATATGGAAFVPEVLEDLDVVFRQIAAELRSQYLLQYYSNNNAPKGQFLRIKVSTPARAELRVRARQGYYAGQK